MTLATATTRLTPLRTPTGERNGAVRDACSPPRRRTGVAAPRRVTRRHRNGLTLVELVLAFMLLGIAITGVSTMVSWVKLQRELTADRQVASLELANIAERLSTRPYDELTSETLSALDLSPIAATELRQPQFSVTVEDETEPVPAKRVTLTLVWLDRGDRPQAPQRLVRWFHAPSPQVQP
ncbi:MAG: type II secretion system protein [Planctomycetaceae bacterium]